MRHEAQPGSRPPPYRPCSACRSPHQLAVLSDWSSGPVCWLLVTSPSQWLVASEGMCVVCWDESSCVRVTRLLSCCVYWAGIKVTHRTKLIRVNCEHTTNLWLLYRQLCFFFSKDSTNFVLVQARRNGLQFGVRYPQGPLSQGPLSPILTLTPSSGIAAFQIAAATEEMHATTGRLAGRAVSGDS